MYNIYREDQFPEGLFRTEEGRQGVLQGAFRDVFMQRNGVEPTKEHLRTECRQIENVEESTYDRLPCLAFYHQGLPLVRLYFRGGKYELHTLAKELSLADAALIMSCDELDHFAVKAEDCRK